MKRNMNVKLIFHLLIRTKLKGEKAQRFRFYLTSNPMIAFRCYILGLYLEHSYFLETKLLGF